MESPQEHLVRLKHWSHVHQVCACPSEHSTLSVSLAKLKNHRPLIVPCCRPLLRKEAKQGTRALTMTHWAFSTSKMTHLMYLFIFTPTPQKKTYKGHNQHSLLSVGLTVWKSSLTDECNCVPDFSWPSQRIMSRYADDALVYICACPAPSLPPITGQHGSHELTGSSDCISITLAVLEGFKSSSKGKAGRGGWDVGWRCRDSWRWEGMTFKIKLHLLLIYDWKY